MLGVINYLEKEHFQYDSRIWRLIPEVKASNLMETSVVMTYILAIPRKSCVKRPMNQA